MKNLILTAALLIYSSLVFGDTNLCQDIARNSVAPKDTSNVEIHANLNSSANVFSADTMLRPYTHTTSMTVYGNNGNYFFLSFFFTKLNDEGKWDFSARLIDETGKIFNHLSQQISFNSEGVIDSEETIEVFSNELPIAINMSKLTQLDSNFSVTCLHQDGWVSYEVKYSEENKLIIPRLKAGTEHYYVEFSSTPENSFKIGFIERKNYSDYEDSESMPYFEPENNIVHITSLLNEHNGRKYSVELHKNTSGDYDVHNLIELD